MDNMYRLAQMLVLLIVWTISNGFVYSIEISGNIAKQDFDKNALLARHNYYRKKVGVPPLKWSDELSLYAQEWANKLASRCQMKHRYSDDYGENIYWTTTPVDATHVVDYWAEEEKLFSHRKRTYHFGKGYGHYTQIIWKDTKLVGGAVANCKNGGQIWVCNYDPPGNWEGEKVY